MYVHILGTHPGPNDLVHGYVRTLYLSAPGNGKE